MIAKLEALVTGGDELSVFRVNPLTFGTEKGLAEPEAIDLFLHAAHEGLFQMDWQLLCPGCGEAVESVSSLQALHSEYYCTTCQMNTQASLDDFIQISFTVSPQIRRIRYHEPDTLPIEDYYFNYVFTRDSHFGGSGAAGVFKSFTCGLADLGPGENKTMALSVAPETLAIADHKTRGACGFSIEGPPASGVQNAAVTILDGKMDSSPSTLAPGRVDLEVENLSGRRAALLLLAFPAGLVKAAVEFRPFLSGKKLLTTQTFRDLFYGDVIEALRGIIQAEGGAVVKTIGDAVMASFALPDGAVKAALAMQREVRRFNDAQGGREIRLKIGLHVGAALVVTLNDRLDYFGQTVNIASRIRDAADEGEICLTREARDFPGVSAFLAGSTVRLSRAALRGVEDEVEVFRVVVQ